MYGYPFQGLATVSFSNIFHLQLTASPAGGTRTALKSPRESRAVGSTNTADTPPRMAGRVALEAPPPPVDNKHCDLPTTPRTAVDDALCRGSEPRGKSNKRLLKTILSV